MKFTDVIEVCLNFSADNGGVLGSYRPGEKGEKLQIQSRTTWNVIIVWRDPVEFEVWHVEQFHDKTREVTVRTADELLGAVTRFWAAGPPILPFNRPFRRI
jgi:hypothetical protein